MNIAAGVRRHPCGERVGDFLVYDLPEFAFHKGRLWWILSLLKRDLGVDFSSARFVAELLLCPALWISGGD